MPFLLRCTSYLAPLLLGCAYLRVPAQELMQDGKKPPDFATEAYVVEQRVDRWAFENDGTETREEKVRLRIQSDAGVQRFGLLTFAYQKANETLDIDYVRVRKPDGSVVPTPVDEVQDMPEDVTREAPFYSDLYEKHLAVKALSSGDVLEFRSLWKVTKPLAPGQFWMDFQFSRDEVILDERLEVSVPRDRPVKVKSPGLAPLVSEEGTRRTYAWNWVNHEHQERLKSETTQLAARGRFPPSEVELSSFQSWQEVGRWYDMLQREQIAPSPDIRAKAEELTRNAADDAAKIQAIYRYVSTQLRYFGVGFGIGRYQPHFAAEVLNNQYGDCKDKHTLLISLLAAVGIRAYPALIDSSHLVDPDVPSPSQFDHLITVVPRGKDSLWLDTTAEVAPLGYLSPLLREKQALVVSPDKGGVLQATPADPPFPTAWTFKIDAKLDDSGTLEGKVEQTMRGDLEVNLRQALRRRPRAEWKDLIQRISYNSGFGGEVSDVTASMPEATEVPLHFSYTYKRKNYPGWEKRRIRAPCPETLLIPPEEDDKLPPSFWLSALGELNFESRVTLPKGYSPDVPANRDLQQDFAEYYSKYSLEDEVLVARYRIVIKEREVSGNRVKDYKTFAEKAAEDRDRFIAISPASGRPDSPQETIVTLQQRVWDLPASKDPGARQAEDDARAAIERRSLPDAISAFQRAVSKDSSYVRGWIFLGQMQMAMTDKEAAINAFRKAVDADPQEPLSYKILALALVSLGRRGEAIQVWQDLAKTVPDDREIPTNLGALLMAEKRYRDAIPFFEAAVKLYPKRSAPQLGLGSAYLRNGQEEKALSVFNSALQLEPTATTKNNIAWDLAVADKRLDDALRYAREAVRDEEEASRKVQLDKLVTADLTHAGTLGAYWDTLGWVYYRLGNLKQAEGYLYAAWLLRQQDLIGFHLGQLYEKTQRRAEAIALYRLVSQSPRRSDDQEAVANAQASLERLNAPVLPGRMHAWSGNLAGQLSEDRTVRLPRLTAKRASAEFFVLLAPGPKVEATKFLSGSDDLRSAGTALSHAKFKVAFPEDSSGRLLRRGILACYPETGCTFVLLPTEVVTSVN
jgi:tetratricopeptide (TPR) repeat protein